MKIKYIFLLFIQTEGVLSVLLWMGECVNTKVIWTYIQILFLFSPFFISAYTFFFLSFMIQCYLGYVLELLKILFLSLKCKIK